MAFHIQQSNTYYPGTLFDTQLQRFKKFLVSEVVDFNSSFSQNLISKLIEKEDAVEQIKNKIQQRLDRVNEIKQKREQDEAKAKEEAQIGTESVEA